MYLYKKFMELEEVLYRKSSFMPREPFIDRVQVEGTLRDQNITIRNLSVHDSGFYSCSYIDFPDREVECNTYLLAVKGAYFFRS